MSIFKPDPSRIDENPFGFQEPHRAIANLQRSLESLVEFFKNEILAESSLYDAWNAYQKRRGNVSIVKFALALKHVMEVQQELAIVKACDRKHVAERLDRFVVLLHIGLIEMLEGGTSPSFRDWAIGSLDSPGFPLPTGSTAAEVRSYLVSLKGRYERDHGSARALREALKGGLSKAERRQLLRAWAFSKPVEFGTEYGRPRHLHCREREEAAKKRQAEREERVRGGQSEPPVRRFRPEMEPVRDYCLDFCPDPTPGETERLLPRLANRLYEMRSMIIHSASAVMLARPDAVSGEAKSGGTLFDCYFMRDGKMIMYEVTSYVGDLVAILRRCLWNRFADQASTKPASS
jgi:hypothetical protein